MFARPTMDRVPARDGKADVTVRVRGIFFSFRFFFNIYRNNLSTKKIAEIAPAAHLWGGKLTWQTGEERAVTEGWFFAGKPLPPGPNAKKPVGAGYFAGSPLPPSSRAAGLAAYKRPAAQPPALILLSSIPVKKKEERRVEEKKGRSPAGFRRRFQVIFIDPICDY